MYWFGKFLGAACGFLVAGPIGAFAGVIVGNIFDKGLSLSYQPNFFHYHNTELIKVQSAFFHATFAVMGHIAKADGHVSQKEIQLARTIMSRLLLNEALTAQAIKFFNEGKLPNFNLLQELAQLRFICHHHHALLRMFIEIQIAAANAEGHVSQSSRRLLETICLNLGFNLGGFANFHEERHSQQSTRATPPPNPLAKAYATLEVSTTASDTEVKQAYRKQMSHNHPDKLVAKGLPAEMMKIATEKTQQIHAAYEMIRKARAANK